MSKIIQSIGKTKKRNRENDENMLELKKTKATGKSELQDALSDLIPKNTREKKPYKKIEADCKTQKESISGESSIIYLGHVPHGFYEKEMKNFFAQFGEVKRLKLFRSTKTGNSKGYAFIDFESSEVAKVVADAMNGYYLLEKQLVCNIVPSSKLHDGMFKYSSLKGKSKNLTKENSNLSSSHDHLEFGKKTDKQVKSQLKQQKKKNLKLKSLGIEFDIFDSLYK